MEPAVFLDRDNTLIANDGDLGDPQAVRLLDGVGPGLAALRELGYRLVVVTNQGGVARGLFTEEDVDAVHQRIAENVDAAANGRRLIDRFYYCPYHPEGSVDEYRQEHPWRKPAAGMLLQAARDMQLDLAASWMIGDTERDVLAGQAAGCRTVLVSRNGSPPAEPRPTATVSSFTEAVQWIQRHTPPAPPAGIDRAGAPPAPGTAGSTAPPPPAAASDMAPLRRAVADLTEELRAQRLRGAEFTALRMGACLTQLLVLLIVLLGLLQLADTDVFLRWMVTALVVQGFAIALLVADLKG